MQFRGRAIIPAAGKGTRVGSPVDGKEMMLDPVTGKPLINWALDLALANGLKPCVIVSSNKTLLNSHIIFNYPDADLLIHDPSETEEWPDTVLVSEPLWMDLNVLILPDTRFNKDIVQKLVDIDQKTTVFAFATHKVSHPTKFGIIRNLSTNMVQIAEKPRTKYAGNTAWGLIAWTSNLHAKGLFDAFRTRGKWLSLRHESIQQFKLEFFKDITRSGEIETY